MLSVNQLYAQVKLVELWKALNIEDYPLEIKQQSATDGKMTTRASEKGRPIEVGMSKLTKNASVSDAVRIWNAAPTDITGAETLYQAKNAIKNYVRSLPI